MAVSNKCSCSCGKSPKRKPALSEGSVNYSQIDSHNYRELVNLKMREYSCSFVLRTHWPKDVSILASTNKPEDTRMWGCEYTNKHTWTWGYEDVRIQGYKQAHMKLRIWGCKDASIQGKTYQPEDIRTWGYKDINKHKPTWGYEDAGMQGRAYEPGNTRM